MRNQAGQSVYELMLQDRLRFIEQNRLPLWVLLICYQAVAGVALFLVSRNGPSPFVWMASGGFVVGLAWMVSWFLDMDNSFFRRRGAWAEQWTRKALLKNVPKGWACIDDILLGSGNVDHILVGPDLVLVVETKWKSTFRGRQARINGTDLGWDVGACRRVTEEISDLLVSRGINIKTKGALVLWGPGYQQTPFGTARIGGTYVLLGDQASEWLIEFAPGNARREVTAVLEAERQRSYGGGIRRFFRGAKVALGGAASAEDHHQGVHKQTTKKSSGRARVSTQRG